MECTLERCLYKARISDNKGMSSDDLNLGLRISCREGFSLSQYRLQDAIRDSCFYCGMRK